mmetsp:Transcript_23914/g.75790  ORF Transcript_23914/g.75790 Transcript_23914/m.75790 type:complete len:281 (-) Transcript_23914:174-1016(-)
MSTNARSNSRSSPSAVARRKRALTLPSSISRTLLQSSTAAAYSSILRWQKAQFEWQLTANASRSRCAPVFGARKCRSCKASEYCSSASVQFPCLTYVLPRCFLLSAASIRSSASATVALGAPSLRRLPQSLEEPTSSGDVRFLVSVARTLPSPTSHTLISASMPEVQTSGNVGCGATQLTTHLSAGNFLNSLPEQASQMKKLPQSPPVPTADSPQRKRTSFAHVCSLTRPSKVRTALRYMRSVGRSNSSRAFGESTMRWALGETTSGSVSVAASTESTGP